MQVLEQLGVIKRGVTKFAGSSGGAIITSASCSGSVTYDDLQRYAMNLARYGTCS